MVFIQIPNEMSGLIRSGNNLISSRSPHTSSAAASTGRDFRAGDRQIFPSPDIERHTRQRQESISSLSAANVSLLIRAQPAGS